jgi:hypothetical protein
MLQGCAGAAAIRKLLRPIRGSFCRHLKLALPYFSGAVLDCDFTLPLAHWRAGLQRPSASGARARRGARGGSPRTKELA